MVFEAGVPLVMIPLEVGFCHGVWLICMMSCLLLCRCNSWHCLATTAPSMIEALCMKLVRVCTPSGCLRAGHTHSIGDA